MSNRRRKKLLDSDHYWQSADYNRRSYAIYRDRLLSLALARFKWVNLPDGCDERFLEFCLLSTGQATIATPDIDSGMWFSTRCTGGGTPNVYDNPTKWQSIGSNGWCFDVTPENGVIVYDNMLRIPIHNMIEMYARRLAHIDRTIDVNLQQQHTPFLITGDRSQTNALMNTYKQISGGEPVIFGTEAFNNLVKIDCISTGVPFIGQELQIVKQNMLAEIYTMLGIDSLTRKAERMIESEVNVQNEPASLFALDPLNARREACEKLNRSFGLNVNVVWREDNASDNYNYIHNVEKREDEGNE